MLNRDSEIVTYSRFVNCKLWICDMNSTLGSVVPLAMFIIIIQTGFGKMKSCKLNLTSKTYFGQGLANILKVWKCKNHFLDFRVSWREDCTGWLCDGRCELLSLVGNLRSHLTCLHTHYTLHTTHTCLHTLPCARSGQQLERKIGNPFSTNLEISLFKSLRTNKNTKCHSGWKSHIFADHPKSRQNMYKKNSLLLAVAVVVAV